MTARTDPPDSSGITDLVSLDAAICACRRCPRLIDWCAEVAAVKRAAHLEDEYWGGPVPGFGSVAPLIWIVGLAPGAHGANRTGRMFTGDRSGDWLFGALHRAGLAELPTSTSRDDGQRLDHVRITAAVHCAPPGNKPTTQEKSTCADWLDREASLVAPTALAVVALGGIAWTATLASMRRAGWQVEPVPFGHAAHARATTPQGRSVSVIASYHPSQQNTFTRRLTEPMLDDVFAAASEAAGLPRPIVVPAPL